MYVHYVHGIYIYIYIYIYMHNYYLRPEARAFGNGVLFDFLFVAIFCLQPATKTASTSIAGGFGLRASSELKRHRSET